MHKNGDFFILTLFLSSAAKDDFNPAASTSMHSMAPYLHLGLNVTPWSAHFFEGLTTKTPCKLFLSGQNHGIVLSMVVSIYELRSILRFISINIPALPHFNHRLTTYSSSVHAARGETACASV